MTVDEYEDEEPASLWEFIGIGILALVALFLIMLFYG